MIGGIFRFVFAFVAFFVVGVAINPALAAVFNGFQLPPLGVFLAQLAGAGLVVASK